MRLETWPCWERGEVLVVDMLGTIVMGIGMDG
jgi:hypothetical protein